MTSKGGTSYDSRTQTEMSAHGEEGTGEVETCIIEGNEENNVGE